LSTYLIGKATPEEVIQVTNINNVYIATSGPIPPNPSELLSNGRIKEFLESIQNSFDFVLIDTPPLGLVTDAVLLAPYIDICFYLVRHKKTPKASLKNITDLQHQGVFKSFNLIFNGVNYNHSAEHVFKYGYGQNKYYNETPVQKSPLSRFLASMKAFF
jgi:capsular exopolysaccharide synthesis family protein